MQTVKQLQQRCVEIKGETAGVIQQMREKINDLIKLSEQKEGESPALMENLKSLLAILDALENEIRLLHDKALDLNEALTKLEERQGGIISQRGGFIRLLQHTKIKH